MAGWDLKSGAITEYEVSEDRIWSLFNYVFSDTSRKRNSYKFGLVKSLLDVEALKIVLSQHPDGLTNKEAYEKIIEQTLYVFLAKKPESVVNGMLRRHCFELDFPTVNLVKCFRIVGYKGQKPLYSLVETSDSASKVSKKDITDDETLSEEKIQEFYNEHLENIYSQLIGNIIAKLPAFFESLIVDLLLKMGYGYDKNSGIVVGGSHDNGIDGVINEDKLGLSLIYLQAKRYTIGNIVGRREIQSFVGAMQNIQKGVFITTSSFTREAIEYAEHQQQKSLKLIDGDMLTSIIQLKYLSVSLRMLFRGCICKNADVAGCWTSGGCLLSTDRSSA